MSDESAIVQSRETAITDAEWTEGGGDARSIQELVGQVKLIRSAMQSVMEKDLHYGVIPGTGNKPTLLKPGAEKLLFLFRLRVVIGDEDVEILDHGNGHRSVRVRCHVISRHGEEISTGVGECSTLESRYRYRNENTGQLVPKEYWEKRDPELLGGPQFSVKKVKDANGRGKWVITHKVEHPDPADYWNTVLKMAKKRALVDGALTATAASDLFTQDVEDMRHLFTADDESTQAGEEKIREPQPKAAPAPESRTKSTATEKPQQEEAEAPKSWGEEQLPDGQEIHSGSVEQVRSKSGTKKDGTPWTRYNICVDGEWFNTFDHDHAGVAEDAQDHGEEVVLTYETDRFGKKIVELLPRSLVDQPRQEKPEGDWPNDGDGDIPF